MGRLTFEGRVYNGLDPRTLLGAYTEGPGRVLRHVVERLDGEYAMALECDGKVVLAVDPLGLRPMYYTSEEFSIHRLPGGELVRPWEVVLIGDEGITFEEGVDFLSWEKEVKEPMKELRRALEEALEKRVKDRVGLLFSGGIDSTLLARLLAEMGKDVTLYSVGLEGSQELELVRSLDLGLKLVVKELREEELEGYARKVVEATGLRDPMQVAIGLPVYAACEAAKEDGQEAVLAGQGADELFGGYHRYLALSPADLEEALREDVRALYRTNVPRDAAIADALGLWLSCPYLDRGVVGVALGIPSALKIKDGMRKYLLRELGRRLGLPEAVWGRRKRAIQYSTGVESGLRRLARGRGQGLGNYLAGLTNRL
ncbi:MAG: asparagine synthetase B [Euryarchaeota archaeon]|nr:asparagine synthetase B [Euryarchaeota archaeon]